MLLILMTVYQNVGHTLLCNSSLHPDADMVKLKGGASRGVEEEISIIRSRNNIRIVRMTHLPTSPLPVQKAVVLSALMYSCSD